MATVKELVDANFNAEAVELSEPVLVQFWAPWCAPCRMMAPVIEQVSSLYVDRVRFFKVNVDENPQSASRFQATSIPLIALIRNHPETGKREAHLSMGYKSEDEVAQFIDALLE